MRAAAAWTAHPMILRRAARSRDRRADGVCLREGLGAPASLAEPGFKRGRLALLIPLRGSELISEGSVGS